MAACNKDQCNLTPAEVETPVTLRKRRGYIKFGVKGHWAFDDEADDDPLLTFLDE
jgi:hypothetical protein